MMRKGLALAAVGLGAAYLMRNKDAREKMSKQFSDFANTPMRGEKNNDNHSSHQPVQAHK